ncbi:MAG: PEP-CTERM sorting domain-containing protein [Opitutaceae bacterium]|nr:PEP-CTERM sorting domain-containing protein [Opitutaceae bacterium]
MRLQSSLPLVGAIFAAAASFASAQVNFDFSSTPSPAFTTAGSTWTLNTTAGTYSTSYTAISTTSTAAITQSSYGGAASSALDFTLSSTFTLNSIGASNSNTIGLGFLGSDAAFTNGYLVDISRSGTGGATFRIVEFNSGIATVISTATVSGLTLTAATTYTISLGSTYIDTNSDLVDDSLSISASFFQGSTLLSSVNTTDNTSQSGTNFGYRLRTASSGAGIDTSFDNFTLSTGAIPEPSTYAALAGLSMLGLAIVRRRRA